MTQVYGTPLHIATYLGHQNVVECLIKNGANVNSVYKEGTPLHVAAMHGHENVVECLVKNGANINSKEALDNSTPLHWAAYNGHENIVACLVKNGANLNLKDIINCTPIHRAVNNGHYNIVNFLINNGDTNSPYNYPCTFCRQPSNGIYAFLPCGHALTCRNCCQFFVIKKKKGCSSCEKKVTNFKQIFLTKSD